MKRAVVLAAWPKNGWWKANVDPNLNPEQVQALLERDAPEHPALPKIIAIVRSWLKAKGRREMFRCHLCRDSKWVWGDEQVRRCTGTHGRCLQDEWEQARVRELKAQAAVNAESGEGATL